MKFGKIWQRFVFWEILKVFFLFLGCFFFLYSLIDYSLHMQDFIVNKKIQISHIATYYLFQFVKRADLLIPLSLLIATLKVLFSMNMSRELVALQASGISLKKIIRPIFLLSFICLSFNWISFEYILPSSLNYLDQFRENHFKHSQRGKRKEPVHVLSLKDGSKIVYQKENKEKKLFIDAFWICSVDEIWRIQTLSSNPTDPIGTYVDQMKRNSEGNFEKVQSFDRYSFSQFKWVPDPIGKGEIPLENRKVSELFKLFLHKTTKSTYQHSQILTQLLFKCTMPLLSFIVVIAASGFCLNHSRTHPVFVTYATALFTFIAFFALMDAAVILGENLVLSPYIAILVPILLSTLGFSYKYLKTCSSK